jgi:hypothetical protein
VLAHLPDTGRAPDIALPRTASAPAADGAVYPQLDRKFATDRRGVISAKIGQWLAACEYTVWSIDPG